MSRKISLGKPHRFSSFLALSAFVGLIGLFTLAGCGGGGGGHNSSASSATPTPTPSGTPLPTGSVVAQTGWAITNPAYVQPTKAWTFLVYMDGANDLDSDALYNFNQMEEVGSNSSVNIVIQFKRGQGEDLYENYTYDSTQGGWSGTRRYYVTQDSDTSSINSDLLSTNATADMGSYQTLQAFVQWGIQTYPATHYALVVWDHGSGWRSESIPTSKSAKVRGAATRSATVANTNTRSQNLTRGVAFDDVSGDYIETTQLSEAIDMGNGKKWDLLAWDCSLMQMMETDYQIVNQVQYIVGSEESPPGYGYPYNTILSDLTSNPTWDGKTFGADIAKQDLAYYVANPYVVQNAETNANVSVGPNYVTQSVIDASQLSTLATAMNNLGAALSSAEGSYASQIANARAATEQYGIDDITYTDPSYEVYESYRDGEGFVNNLISGVSSSGVQSAAKAAQSAFQAAILTNYVGTSHANSHGLAMYIPTPSDYVTDDGEQAAGGLWGYGPNDRYAQLAFPMAAPNWQSFLVNATQ